MQITLYLGAGFPTTPCPGILDDVLKGESSLQHHSLLAGDHLLVDGVVEVSHLLEDHTMAIESLGGVRRVLDFGRNGEPKSS